MYSHPSIPTMLLFSVPEKNTLSRNVNNMAHYAGRACCWQQAVEYGLHKPQATSFASFGCLRCVSQHLRFPSAVWTKAAGVPGIKQRSKARRSLGGQIQPAVVSSQEQTTWLNRDVPKVLRTEVICTRKSPRESLAKKDHQMFSNLARNRHGYLHISVRRLQVCLSTSGWDWTDFGQPPKTERLIPAVSPVLKCWSQQSHSVQCFGQQPTGDAHAKCHGLV